VFVLRASVLVLTKNKHRPTLAGRLVIRMPRIALILRQKTGQKTKKAVRWIFPCFLCLCVYVSRVWVLFVVSWGSGVVCLVVCVAECGPGYPFLCLMPCLLAFVVVLVYRCVCCVI